MIHPSTSRSIRRSPLVLALACVAPICVSLVGAGAPMDDAPSTARSDSAGDAPKEPLRTGDRLPSARLRTADDLPVRLSDIVVESPIILILYRGGWCPYCTRHLAEIGAIGDRLDALGFRTIAVSPDRPERLVETKAKGPVNLTLLSDSDMRLATELGLSFRVDDQTLETYRGFGIDLAAASGREHRMLPVPAVYLVDSAGIIQFAHHDDDYRERSRGAALLAAAERISAETGSP